MREIQYQECEVHGQYQCGYIEDGRYSALPGGCGECATGQAMTRILERFGPRFRDCEFENYEANTSYQREILNACQEFANNLGCGEAEEGANLILSGPAGVGKNHLAVAIAKSLIRRGKKVRYWRLQNLLQSYWAMSIEEKERWLDRFIGIDLLILDELDKSPMNSESAQRSVFDLIDYVWREEIPVVILTSLNSEGLQHYLGEDVFDRICERSLFITMNWGSYRRRVHMKERVEHV